MNLIDQHFEEALRDIPQKKLSFWANRRIRKQMKQRYYELEGRPLWLIFLPRLVAVPVALMLVVTTTAAYGFYSPTIIQSDWLYRVKERGEVWLYPTDKEPEERISYHLWLSDRRYDEVREILRRKTGQEIVFVPNAKAHGNGDGHDEESGDPLDAILQSTLQRAAENVETAFVIAEEIREVPRVAKVKEQITIAVEKQQQWLQKAKPVLAQVQLRKPQIERRRRLQANRERTLSARNLPSTMVLPTPADIPFPDFRVATQPVGAEPSREPLPDLPFPLFPIPVEAPPTTDTLLEETIAFQHALLHQMEEAVRMAQVEKKETVSIALDEFLEPLEKFHESEVLEIAKEMHEKKKEQRDFRESREPRDERRPEEPTEIAKTPVPPVSVEERADHTGKELKRKRKAHHERKSVSEEQVEIAGIAEPVEEAETAEEPETPKIAETIKPVEIASEKPEVSGAEMVEGATRLEEVPGVGPTEGFAKPESAAVKKEKEKDECEKKADKVCEKSDEKDCQEKAIKECREEKEKKKEEKPPEFQREIQDINDHAKKGKRSD